MLHTISIFTALALVIPGVFIAFIPMLPALAYMFVVALLFGIINGFDKLSSTELVILFGFVAVSFIVDNVSGLIGAKYGGARTKSLVWGIIGSIIGFFLLPPFGAFVGLFFGVLFAELHYKKTQSSAIKAASGALIGTMVGVGINVILAIAFAITFAFFIFS